MQRKSSMGVEGSASPEEIIRAVENAGYEAALMGEGKARASERESSSEAVSQFNENLKEQEKALEDRDTPRLRKRLILSATFLLVLMYWDTACGDGLFHLRWKAITLQWLLCR